MIKKILSFSYNRKIGSYELKINTQIILILLLSAFLTFYNLPNRGVLSWDEGDYLHAAATVAQGEDIRYLAVGFKFVHNLINSIFFWMFGAYDYIGFASSGVFALLTVYLTYLIGDKLFGKEIGLYSALVLSVTEYFIYFSRSAYAEMHLTFFFVLTLFLYVNGLFKKDKINLVLIGILVSVCYATKNVGALVLPIILISEVIFFISGKQDFKTTLTRSAIIITSAIAILIPFIMAIKMLAPPQLQAVVAYKVTGRAYDVIFRLGQGADFFFYPYALLKLSSVLTVAFFILGTITSVAKRRVGDWIILTWFFFLYLYLSAFPQHRFKIFVIALPAVALLVTRGLDWVFSFTHNSLKNLVYDNNTKKFKLKKEMVIAPILILLVLFSLSNAYNTITISSLGYKHAAEIIKQDGGKNIISTDAGKIRFYALPYKVKDLDVCNDISSLKEAYANGYTHIVLDWRGGRISRSMGWNKTKDFRDKILYKSEPIAVLDNNNLHADELNVLYHNMVKNMKPAETERYRNWLDKEYVETHNITGDRSKYNDRFGFFKVYHYVDDDPCRDKIYVFRISDVLVTFS